MNKRVEMRYKLCEQCLSGWYHTERTKDKLLKGIVECSLESIALVLANQVDVEWKNYPVAVSRGAGYTKAFADSEEDVCRHCDYKMEHVVFGGGK